MNQASDHSTASEAGRPFASGLLAALGIGGIAVYIGSLWAIRPLQFQVVNYSVLREEPSTYWPPLLVGLSVLVVLLVLAVWGGQRTTRERHARAATCRVWPLVFCGPLAAYGLVEQTPPFALSLVMILATGWAAFRVGTQFAASPRHRDVHGVAFASLVVLVLAFTFVHTRLQINFFEHFMLGHADFGHFTEELKNALAGRGLRCDSFENTRLGWHFVPLLYVLVPGYALWPSPVYLMVCSALFVHVVALPAYYFARKLSGSVVVGWMFGMAWLLLPSQSRLVYSNTYGFQWIYFAMPLLGLMVATGVTGRWRTCLVIVGILLLCKETVAAATFGWGLYILLFTPRRRMGVVIMLASLVYFILCVKLLIPHFAATGRYERLDLFGELGSTPWELLSSAFTRPGLFLGQLIRVEVLYFLLILLIPMALLPIGGWRVAVAALPTLLLVPLLENEDWLSIKFWHQCTVLPLIFFAGIAGIKMENRSRILVWLSGHRACSIEALHRGMALTVLMCAAMGHYFYGFSPISKSYESYVSAAVLHEPDPRLATVHRLRSEIPKDRTILATERLAPHFVDFKRIYTGGRVRPVDFVIIDRSDGWDTSGLSQQASRYADNPHYQLSGEYGSIIVFQRAPDAPPVPLD